MRCYKKIGMIVLLVFSVYNFSYSQNKKNLTFEQAFLNKGEKLYAELPKVDGWADDDHYYEIKDEKLYKVSVKKGKFEIVFDSAEYKELSDKKLDIFKADDRTQEREKFVFIKDDDLFLFERETKTLTQITATKEKETNPIFSPNGEWIAYTASGNLFAYNILNKKNYQLTSDGSETILNGYASWVYYEEILGRALKYRAYWWSPDSEKIVFIRFDQSKVPVFTLTRYNGDYCELEKQFYPKSGYPNPDVKIGIAEIKTGNLYWVNFKDDKDHYLSFPHWNESSDRVYFQWMNRGQDHIKLLECDRYGENVNLKYEEKQESWVDFLEDGGIEYRKNGEILLISSRDGWYHLYLVSKDKDITQITSGEWSVRRIIGVDKKKRLVYFTANKEDSAEMKLYKVSLTNKKIECITEPVGTHFITISPGLDYFIDRNGAIDRPTYLELRNIDGKLLRILGNIRSKVIESYSLGTYSYTRIPISDGYNLPAVQLLPPDFSPEKKYPALLNIYGGPATPIVRNSYKDNLGAYFIAQQGIIQLWVDHRGSGHFGKKGEALMHRRLGHWEINDFIEVVKYLRTLPYVEGDKIGISGGSYGGYLSALAICSAPEYFRFADAGSPVIDWHLYDSVYTERYMDAPEENPEGYKNSSVLSIADNYRSGLRITHGTMDDNVHMQNTMLLVDKLIEAGKTLELMVYPGERHVFTGNKRAHDNRDSVNFWLRSFFGKLLD